MKKKWRLIFMYFKFFKRIFLKSLNSQVICLKQNKKMHWEKQIHKTNINFRAHTPAPNIHTLQNRNCNKRRKPAQPCIFRSIQWLQTDKLVLAVHWYIYRPFISLKFHQLELDANKPVVVHTIVILLDPTEFP